MDHWSLCYEVLYAVSKYMYVWMDGWIAVNK